jgi:hypothetical protein
MTALQLVDPTFGLGEITNEDERRCLVLNAIREKNTRKTPIRESHCSEIFRLSL